MDNLQAIRDRLVYAREKAGLTQAQAGKLLFVTQSRMSQVEHDFGQLHLELFLKMCETYGVSVIWVITGINPYFDLASAIEAAHKLGMPEADLRNFVEALAMQAGFEP